MELWYLNGQSVVKRLEDINLNLIFPFSDSLVRKKIPPQEKGCFISYRWRVTSSVARPPAEFGVD